MAIVLVVIGVYLGFTKDIPFTKPFQMSAVFENAPPIQKGTAVRIAGVDVGKVSKVEPVGGDSQGVKVTMKLEDEALPIHKDAAVKVRERIFLEGNLFMDIKPGSPSADTIEDGDTIPAVADRRAGAARPGAGHAHTPTPARTSRTCSRATATRSTASRSRARTTTR